MMYLVTILDDTPSCSAICLCVYPSRRLSRIALRQFSGNSPNAWASNLSCSRYSSSWLGAGRGTRVNNIQPGFVQRTVHAPPTLHSESINDEIGDDA